MVLHTLSAAPSGAAFNDCLKVLQAGDTLVLFGDGVYAALEGTAACDKLRATQAELFVLESDARLAGIAKTAANISWLDMDGLVALTERFPRQLAWY
ncbi:Protein TusB [Halioglobus japonicus]|nr:Protein TusB [Halioglobus japonicus]